MSKSSQKRVVRAPNGLGTRGRRLWREINATGNLDASQKVLLEEACRMADRLDELNSVIQGKGVLDLMQFRLKDAFEVDGENRLVVEVRFQNVLAEARQQQNVFKQLLVALRLPDEEGERAKPRVPRGAYSPATGEAPRKALESALERAKNAAV